MQSLDLGDPKNRLKIIGNQNWDILNSCLEVEANLSVISLPSLLTTTCSSLSTALLLHFLLFFFNCSLVFCLCSLLGPTTFLSPWLQNQEENSVLQTPMLSLHPVLLSVVAFLFVGVFWNAQKSINSLAKYIIIKTPLVFLFFFSWNNCLPWAADMNPLWLGVSKGDQGLLEGGDGTLISCPKCQRSHLLFRPCRKVRGTDVSLLITWL